MQFEHLKWLPLMLAGACLMGCGPSPGAVPQAPSAAPKTNNATNRAISTAAAPVEAVQPPPAAAVPRAPVIRRHPIDQYQVPGGNVTFRALGLAHDRVAYQWQRDGINLPGATNALLALTNVQEEHQGVYSVMVSNEVGTLVSSNAHLRLVTAPRLISQSPEITNLTVPYHKFLTLTVDVAAPGASNGFPVFYQWQRDGTNIPGATSRSLGRLADFPVEGIYRLGMSNALGSTSATWRVTVSHAGSYVGEGTLGHHLSTNVAERARDQADINRAMNLLSGWAYDTYSGASLGRLTNAKWSSNCWLAGVQGLSATCIGYSNGLGGRFLLTMVSPRHYLMSAHVGPGPMIAFLDTNNVIHWRRSVQRVILPAQYSAGLQNDVSVGLLDADLPPSVGFLPVLPPSYTNYFPSGSFSHIQAIGMNQDMKVFSLPITFSSLNTLNWNHRSSAPFGLSTNWGVVIRGGDSSLPVRLLMGNQLVLLSSQHYATGGPNYARHFDAINQHMHYLSTNNLARTDYQLTPCDLTRWPALR